MTTIDILNCFPSFYDFDQTIDDKKCIFPARSTNFQRCGNRIHSEDLERSRLLRNTVVEAPSALDRLELLRQYCSLRCCKSLHRKMLGPELANQVVQTWQRDIGVEIHEPRTHASIASLPANVAVDESHTHLRQRASRVTHRYALRSRVSQEDQTPVSLAEPQGCDRDFEAYGTKASQSVHSLLNRPLSGRDQMSGSLYMFTRSSSPGFVKIGLTTIPVPKRLSVWQKKCQYVPIVQHEIHNVPHVYRVESLIHFQLVKYRRREKWCKNCCRSHKEWFEIDIDTARAVMDGWVEWVRTALPFDADGCLKDTWRIVLNSLEAENLTAQTLLDSMSSPVVQNQGRLSGKIPVTEDSRKAHTTNRGVGVSSTPSPMYCRRNDDNSAQVANILRAITALSATNIERLFQELEMTRAKSFGSDLLTPAPSLSPVEHFGFPRNQILVQPRVLEALA